MAHSRAMIRTYRLNSRFEIRSDEEYLIKPGSGRGCTGSIARLLDCRSKPLSRNYKFWKSQPVAESPPVNWNQSGGLRACPLALVRTVTVFSPKENYEHNANNPRHQRRFAALCSPTEQLPLAMLSNRRNS